MDDCGKIEESKMLMESLFKALDAKSAHALEGGPDEPGHREKLKELEQAAWEAHSRWESFVRSNFK